MTYKRTLSLCAPATTYPEAQGLEDSLVQCLAKAFLAHVCDRLVAMGGTGADLRKSSEVPKHVLVRSFDTDWACHSFASCFEPLHHTCVRLRAVKRKLAVDGLPGDSAFELQCFGALLRVQYAGPFLDCSGPRSSFQPSPATVPQVPASASIRLRKTYWRWFTPDNQVDLLFVSKHALFLAYLHLEGLSADSTPHELFSVHARLALPLLGDFSRFLGPTAVILVHDSLALCDTWGLRCRDFFADASSEVWQQRSLGVARPLCLQDYHRLAEQANLTYLGCNSVGAETVPHAIPKTMFVPAAVFLSAGGQLISKSYYSMYFEFHRHQPTISRVKHETAFF